MTKITQIDAVKFQEALDAMCVDKDKQIAELQEIIAKQAMQIAHDSLTLESYNNKFFQMQVQINEFRYLLELCQNGLRWYQDTHPEDASPEDDELHLAINYRLNKTPAQCLIQHDNEVIERCAKVCDERENDARFRLNDDKKSSVAYLCAVAIRELKG